MIFIETSVFTKVITALIPEDCYKELQLELLLRPDAGALIKGGGGIRKIRWNAGSTGKRGGIRVIYYLDLPDRIFMLYAYKKNQQEDLTQEQVKVLKQIALEWLL
jgi:hypothetical protein